jgi:hypothetical protein
LENGLLTKVDGVNVQNPETLGARLQTKLASGINFKGGATLDETELACEEDFIALSSAFEPSTD